MRVKQVSVFLENRSGRLADVTRTLARAGVNIRALSIADTVDYGFLRLIVDKPDLAVKSLSEEGFTVALTEVLALAVPDRPGGLAEIVELISEKGLNIEYMYAFVGKSEGNAVVVFRVDPINKAVEALQKAGVRILTGEDLQNI